MGVRLRPSASVWPQSLWPAFWFPLEETHVALSLCCPLESSILALSLSPSVVGDSFFSFRARFLNLIWGLIIPCLGDYPVPCRMFNSIPDLCPIDPSTHLPQLVTIKNVSRYCQMSLRGNIVLVSRGAQLSFHAQVIVSLTSSCETVDLN